MKEYISLEDKQKSFEKIDKKCGQQYSFPYWCINTEEELLKLIDFLKECKSHCIFRGVNEAKYMIFTSYQVNAQMGKIDSLDVVDFVQECINNLKKNHNGLLPLYYNSMDVLDSDFVYISLLQHYGAPSPFLDFTPNWENAMFFAIDKVKSSNDADDINGYISIYWIDLLNQKELMTIRDAYANEIFKAVNGVVDFLKENDVPLCTNNLNIEKFFAWSDSENRGEGTCKVPLAYVDNNQGPIDAKTAWELEAMLEDIKTKAKQHNKDLNALLSEFYEECKKSIKKNIKIINLNEVAQDGCFMLYSPGNIDQPLEDYWVNNVIFEYLPELHCVNIHKSLLSKIKKVLREDGITKQSIYPNLKTIAGKAWRTIGKG